MFEKEMLMWKNPVVIDSDYSPEYHFDELSREKFNIKMMFKLAEFDKKSSGSLVTCRVHLIAEDKGYAGEIFQDLFKKAFIWQIAILDITPAHGTSAKNKHNVIFITKKELLTTIQALLDSEISFCNPNKFIQPYKGAS